MATDAVARATVCALRHQIAKIEGRLPEALAVPADATVLRRGAASRLGDCLPTGVESLDGVLGGGLPNAALTEIHAAETRDSGLSAGFALALAALAGKEARDRPLLWIGTAEIFREAGVPYAAGLAGGFGIAAKDLLFAEVQGLADALWVAEEAAKLDALSAVILELRGNPQKLDLTATRRLHRRAEMAGRPVLLLRQSAHAEPTAAPVRLVVSPAPAARCATLAGPLARLHRLGRQEPHRARRTICTGVEQP
jgi:protein ImuA